MRNHLLRNLLAILIVTLLVAGCNQSTKTKEVKGTNSEGKEASVEVEVFDALKLKDQIVEIIETTPKAEEITDFVNEVGASYIFDLTVATTAIDKFMTETQMSMALGLYGFDLVYAKTYQRADMVTQLSDIEEQLIKELGIEDGHNSYKTFGDRIKANVENKDSLDYLVTEMMNQSYQKFMSCEHTYIYALSFIATNIEGLYILSQLTMLAQNNAPMLQFLSQQGERIKSVYSLLELISDDENVKPLYNDFIPLVKFFEENPTIDEEGLNNIAPVIEKLRKSML
ncbi:MAG: hypothetical protein PF541_17140 [Prolixibacteraceae bacterium]|jgi:hypothetical protein|nr:hypothetical protein [Prolixibacteraceae bacterium]